MLKRVPVFILLLIIALAPVLTGCFGPPSPPPPPPVDQQSEGEAPDYKAIEDALQDQSLVVRDQALKTLGTYEHSSAIKIYIKAIKDNLGNDDIVKTAIRGISRFGDKAIEPVRTDLWDSDSLELKEIAFKILQNVSNKEEFYPEVIEMYISMPFNTQTAALRLNMARYICSNADPENKDALTTLVGMLIDPDKKVINTASQKLGEWKSKEAVKSMTEIFKENYTNENTVLGILYALTAYPIPSGNDPAPISDITVFLWSFGSYNTRIQEESYKGLKTYGYDDDGHVIVDYINTFTDCNYDLVRSHVIALPQEMQKNIYPPDLKPEFELPPPRGRQGYCK